MERKPHVLELFTCKVLSQSSFIALLDLVLICMYVCMYAWSLYMCKVDGVFPIVDSIPIKKHITHLGNDCTKLA